MTLPAFMPYTAARTTAVAQPERRKNAQQGLFSEEFRIRTTRTSYIKWPDLLEPLICKMHAGKGQEQQRVALWATVVHTASSASTWTTLWKDQMGMIALMRVLPSFQLAIRKRFQRLRLQGRSPAFRTLQRAAAVVSFPIRAQLSIQRNSNAANTILSVLRTAKHPLFRWHFASKRLFKSIQSMQRLWHSYKLATASRMSLLSKVWDEVEAVQLKRNDSSKQEYIRNILIATNHNSSQQVQISHASRQMNQGGLTASRDRLPQLSATSASVPGNIAVRTRTQSGATLQRPRSAVTKKHKLLQGAVQKRYNAMKTGSEPQTKAKRARRPSSANATLCHTVPTRGSCSSAVDSIRDNVLYATKNGVMNSRSGQPGAARRLHLQARRSHAEPKIESLSESLPGQRAHRKRVSGVPEWLTDRGVVYVPDDSRRGKLVACGYTKQPVPRKMRQVLIRRFLTLRRREYAKRLRRIREANLIYAQNHAMSLSNDDSRFILEQPKEVVAAALEFHIQNALKLKPVATPPLLVLRAAKEAFPKLVHEAIEAGMSQRRTFLAQQPAISRASRPNQARQQRHDPMQTLSLSHKQVADIVENLHHAEGVQHLGIQAPSLLAPSKQNSGQPSDAEVSTPSDTIAEATQNINTTPMRPQSRRASTASSTSAVPVWEAPLAAVAWRKHNQKKRPLSRGMSFSKFASPQVMKLAACALQRPPPRSLGAPDQSSAGAAVRKALTGRHHKLLQAARKDSEPTNQVVVPGKLLELPNFLAPPSILTVSTDFKVGEYDFGPASSPGTEADPKEKLRRAEIRQAIDKHRKHIAKGSAIVARAPKLQARGPPALLQQTPKRAAEEPPRTLKQAVQKVKIIEAIWHR